MRKEEARKTSHDRDVLIELYGGPNEELRGEPEDQRVARLSPFTVVFTSRHQAIAIAALVRQPYAFVVVNSRRVSVSKEVLSDLTKTAIIKLAGSRT